MYPARFLLPRMGRVHRMEVMSITFVNGRTASSKIRRPGPRVIRRASVILRLHYFTGIEIDKTAEL